MKRRGVEVIRDRGDFAGPNAVAVGGETLEAKHIVIATGSNPRKLPSPGAEPMITSDDVLSERKLPASVVFVGGGVIALEFSHVHARAGAKVTILAACRTGVSGGSDGTPRCVWSSGVGWDEEVAAWQRWQRLLSDPLRFMF